MVEQRSKQTLQECPRYQRERPSWSFESRAERARGSTRATDASVTLRHEAFWSRAFCRHTEIEMSMIARFLYCTANLLLTSNNVLGSRTRPTARP